jgi:hypothetical protein
MSQDEWAPHAEKEFGRFTRTLAKELPAKLTQLRRMGKQIQAKTATTTRKVKR